MRGLGLSTVVVCLSACGAGAEPARCRLYLTESRWVITGAGIAGQTNGSTCSFDRGKLTLSCTARTIGSDAGTDMSTTTWPNIEAVVAQNHPIGRITALRTSSESSSCTLSWTFGYDAQKRLVSIDYSTGGGCGSTSYAFDSWDRDGRPLSGTSDPRTPGCTEKVLRIYDDAGRTVTEGPAPGGTCNRATITRGYDADGLLLWTKITPRSGEPLTTTYEHIAKASICE